MTPHQKALALSALPSFALRIDVDNRWYASSRAEIGGDGMLSAEAGRGETPEEAIEAYWQILTKDLAPEKHLVIEANTPHRYGVRWNGFMWARVA